MRCDAMPCDAMRWVVGDAVSLCAMEIWMFANNRALVG